MRSSRIGDGRRHLPAGRGRQAVASRTAVGRSAIHGYGLFPTSPLAAGEIVTVSRILVTRGPVPTDFLGHVYTLSDGRMALPCGDGIMVNHSDDPNACAELDLQARTITLLARRSIAGGEEITIDYGG